MPLITDMCCYRCSCLQMSCKTMEGFRSRRNWRNGGLDFENAGNYHLSARALAVEDSLLIGILALFYCFCALLVIRCLFLSKRWEMFYVSPRCRCSRACSSDYFWTPALSWQVPKRRKCPSKKKSKLGDDVASGKKNQDLFRELQAQGLPQCPQARWRLLNKREFANIPELEKPEIT